MKKWALSAIVYLIVIVGGYYIYAFATGAGPEQANHASVDEGNNSDMDHSKTDTDEGHDNGSEEGHSEHGENPGGSELLPMIHEENGDLVIRLKDQIGNPVSDLEVNHEKLMHLIVVSSDLKEYNHLHPHSNKPGVFKTPHTLKDGEYKIFVDIKPKDLAYEVQPITFIIGNPHEEHEPVPLEPDMDLVKQVGGHTVTISPTSFKANEEIQLNFDLNGEKPEPHLGALGHVVILDEKAENYLHVHPLHGDEPIFETKFTQPGIYKIWAEFKFNGEVSVFPYVVEIK